MGGVPDEDDGVSFPDAAGLLANPMRRHPNDIPLVAVVIVESMHPETGELVLTIDHCNSPPWRRLGLVETAHDLTRLEARSEAGVVVEWSDEDEDD